MVDILMSITFNVLLEKYSIEGNEGWTIELDSSTTEKFSYHVIIRIPNIAFKDNSHVGAFVFEVCSRISSQRGSNSQLGKLYIAKDSTSSDLQLFLDSAVYTRNRCFRLAFSSKAGKNSFLLPTGHFKCKNMVQPQLKGGQGGSLIIEEVAEISDPLHPYDQQPRLDQGQATLKHNCGW
ncbi:DNA-directed primase/polymerase protein isoform X4 [Canna indica]|uniref:DNA-directed primase/polymerase protein n=1 Tax=Canna indica TaxID=4628 RepID=A0AAQ3QGF1_9LILI|nr:DNA-directed primase/polymerase protein isoform X4 [Canna indica]